MLLPTGVLAHPCPPTAASSSQPASHLYLHLLPCRLWLLYCGALQLDKAAAQKPRLPHPALSNGSHGHGHTSFVLKVWVRMCDGATCASMPCGAFRATLAMCAGHQAVPPANVQCASTQPVLLQDPTQPEQELEEPEEKGNFVCALTGRVRPRRERIQVGVAEGVRGNDEVMGGVRGSGEVMGGVSQSRRRRCVGGGGEL